MNAKAPRKRRSRKATLAASVVLGRAVRAARLQADMTQVQLAKLCGLPSTKMPGVEKGSSDLRLSTAQRIADALGVSLSDLLKK